MFMKKWMTIPAMTLMMATTPALAEDGRMMKKWHGGDRDYGSYMMEKADANKDGLISKSEFLAPHEEKFDKMDADNDGNVTKEEIKAYKEAKHKKMQDEWFDKADKDGDGKLSKEELEAHKEQMHDRMKERRHDGEMMMDDED